MPKYKLTDQQRQTIGTFVKFAKECRKDSFYVIVSGKVNLHSSEHINSNSDCSMKGLDLPTGRTFYRALDGLGFFQYADFRAEDFTVTLNQIAYECGSYLEYGKLRRGLADTAHALVSEETLAAKAAWAIFGFLAGGIVGFLLG